MPEDNRSVQARVSEYKSPGQLQRSIAQAATHTGPVSAPQVYTGSAGDISVVIDTRHDYQVMPWTSVGIYAEGNTVTHVNRRWIASQATPANNEPAAGSSYWTEYAPDPGGVAAKVALQNVGTNALLVAEGGTAPTANAFHFAVAAGSANNDGLGGFCQWEDFRGLILVGSAGAWRYVKKIIWATEPVH